MEEHPRSSSLGGLQGVPGAAALPAEQKRLRSRDAGRSGLHTHTAAGRSRREWTESVAKTPLRPDDLRRCNSRARMQLVWSLLVFDFKLWKCALLKSCGRILMVKMLPKNLETSSRLVLNLKTYSFIHTSIKQSPVGSLFWWSEVCIKKETTSRWHICVLLRLHRAEKKIYISVWFPCLNKLCPIDPNCYFYFHFVFDKSS